MLGLTFRVREELIYSLHDMMASPMIVLVDDTIEQYTPSDLEGASWLTMGALAEGTLNLIVNVENAKQTYLSNVDEVEMMISVPDIAKYLIIGDSFGSIYYIQKLVVPIDLINYLISGYYNIPEGQLKIYI